jgi:hypothetical protein
VTVQFSESIAAFVQSDITVTGPGTISSFAATGIYTAETTEGVTPAGGSATFTLSTTTDESMITVHIPAPADDTSPLRDNAKNILATSNTLEMFLDSTLPTVAISTHLAATGKDNPLPFTLTFSEQVTSFVVGDVSVTSGTATIAPNTATAGTLSTYNGNNYYQIWDLSVVPHYGEGYPTGEGFVYITVQANAWKDRAANIGTADSAQQVQFYDATPPVPTITSTEHATGTNGNAGLVTTTPLTLTVTMSEDVFGFDVTDMVTDGSASFSNFVTATANTVFTLSVTPSGNGRFLVLVPENVFVDSNTVENTASNTLEFKYDIVAPTTTLTTQVVSPVYSQLYTNVSPVPFSVVFSERVQSFTASDITITGGTVNTLAVVAPVPDILSDDAHSFTLSIEPASTQSTIVVSVAANAVSDHSGKGNTASATKTVNYDVVAPVGVITSSSTTSGFTNVSPIPLAIDFPESVLGFTSTLTFLVTNGAAASPVGGSPAASFTSSITPTAGFEGTIDVSLKYDQTAGVTDLAGNIMAVSATLSRVYDVTAPTATISSAANTNTFTSSVANTNTSPIPIGLLFSEIVLASSFTAGDFTVSNGSPGNLATADASGAEQTYTLDVTPAAEGTVTVFLNSGSVTDRATNAHAASATLTFNFDTTAPAVTLTSSTATVSNTRPFVFTATLSEPVRDFNPTTVNTLNIPKNPKPSKSL